MKSGKIRLFNPHDSARADSLAGARLAPFGRRLAAYAFDLFALSLIYLPLSALLQYWLIGRLHLDQDLYSSAHVHIRFEVKETLDLLWIVWLILYFGLIVFKTNGLTPGKRLLRIRVVSLTHPRLTLWQSIERALGYGASMLEAGFGFLQYFIEPNHRCVHDRIAETIVVSDPVPKN
jgi:uncharacterized RDD family membrane protein YckC